MSSSKISEEKKLIAVSEQNKNFSNSKNADLVVILLNTALINVILLYPQGIQSNLMANPYNFSNFQYGIYYSIYCLPSIFSPLFFGFYLDKNGIKITPILLISFLNILGLIVEALGAYFINYYLMIIGRFIVGANNECNSFLVKRLCLLLFTKKQMIFIWGFYLFFMRIGSSLGSAIAPYLYELTESIPSVYIFSTLVGVLIAFLNIFLDFRIRNKNNLSLNNNDNEEKVYWKELLVNFFRSADKIVWFAIVMIIFNFMRLTAFMSEMNKIIMEETGDTETEAANYIVFYDFFLGIFQICFSYVFSKIGYYIFEILIASPNIMISITFFMPLYTGIDPNYRILIALIWLCLSYSMESNFMFSCLGNYMPKEYFGMTYGIFQGCINFGSLCGVLIFSLIRQYSGSYTLPLCETFLLEMMIFGTGTIIFFLDKKNKNIFFSKPH